MSYTDKLIEEYNGSDEPQSTLPKEDPKPEEKVETVETVETPKEEPKPEDPKPEEPSQEEPKAEEQPKPDLSKLTKQEKAEHAFKRQFAKQKERHDAEIADLKASFQKQFDEFKASMTPKEQPKSRMDFQTDDEYITYLAEQKVNGIMADRDAKAAKDAEEAEAKRKEAEAIREANEEMSRTFGENSRKAFADETVYNEYSKKVNRAIENGLGEVLDQVPAVRDFIFRNPEGPVVLNKMLSDRESFVRVMSQTDPTMMIIAAHELAREAREPVAEPVHEEVKVPHLGKPGARNQSSEAGSVFGSDRSLMSFVRSVNHRRR